MQHSCVAVVFVGFVNSPYLAAAAAAAAAAEPGWLPYLVAIGKAALNKPIFTFLFIVLRLLRQARGHATAALAEVEHRGSLLLLLLLGGLGTEEVWLGGRRHDAPPPGRR